MKEKFKKLNAWNYAMSALHFFQGIIVLVIATDFALPAIVNYLTFDESSQSLVTTSNTLLDVEIAWLVAIFLLLSSFFHLSNATWYRKTYEKNLKKGINKARWYEYSLSASTMIVAIAMLAGIYDIVALIALFALTATMNLTGLIMEVENSGRKKISWLSYNVGTFAGLVPWIGIGLTLWAAGYYAEGASSVPTFVYAIFFTIFVAFSVFAVNMILQYKKIGKWKDYLYGEKMYMVLSLVAKSVLAWQVFGGTLQP